MSVRQSVTLSIYQPVKASMLHPVKKNLSIGQSPALSTRPSSNLSISQSANRPICLSAHPSICLSANLASANLRISQSVEDLFVNPSIRQFFQPPILLPSIRQSVDPSICPGEKTVLLSHSQSVHLSIGTPPAPAICPSVNLSIFQSAHPSICQSVNLSTWRPQLSSRYPPIPSIRHSADLAGSQPVALFFGQTGYPPIWRSLSPSISRPGSPSILHCFNRSFFQPVNL